jgi:hypothetical protein
VVLAAKDCRDTKDLKDEKTVVRVPGVLEVLAVLKPATRSAEARVDRERREELPAGVRRADDPHHRLALLARGIP